MAISKNLYTRGMSQRLGGAVFYQNNGQTVVRELAPSVKNPRTTAQMIQRARLANLVSMYRANLEWMKRGAFETKKPTQSDYNKFVSVNSAAQPLYFTKAMVAGGASVVDSYMITQGSYPSVTTVLSGDGQNIVSNLYLDPTVISGTVDVATTTVAQLTEALLSQNDIIKEGDQLSLILNYQRMSSASVPFVIAQSFELILSMSDTRTLAAVGFPEAFVSVQQGANKALAISVNNDQMGAAIILSRTVGGRIMVSTQELVLSGQQKTVVSQYRTQSALDAYLKSYGEGSNDFLDSNVSGGGSGSSASGPALLTDVNGIAGGSASFNLPASQPVVLTFNKTAPQPASSGTAVRITPQNGSDKTITASDITVNGNSWTIAGTAISSTILNVVAVSVLYESGDGWAVNFKYSGGSTGPGLNE